jgi:hypothetical protein
MPPHRGRLCESVNGFQRGDGVSDRVVSVYIEVLVV